MARQQPIVILGGGLGGLTLALSLAKLGMASVVLERAPSFAEVGAGVTIGPNATRVFDWLGLRAGLDRLGNAPGAGQIVHYRTGECLMTVQRDDSYRDAARAGVFQIHRADLLSLLVEAAQRSSLVEIRCGEDGVGFETEGDAVTVVTAEGRRITGRALVGCDGIKSVVAKALFGAQPPRFTQQIAWRFLVPGADAAPFMGPVSSAISIGPGAIFNRYFIRGRALLNCIGIARTDGWSEEGWNLPSSAAEFSAHFAGWHDDILALAACAPADGIFKWGLFDRAALPRWSQGRVTVLGDAAHPMLPFMGLGAAMAVEDACILARCLHAFEAPEAALQRYEALRIGRCTEAQSDSRRQGELYQSADPDAYGSGGGELRLPYYAMDVTTQPLDIAGAGQAGRV